jgi:hypothetical protein
MQLNFSSLSPRRSLPPASPGYKLYKPEAIGSSPWRERAEKFILIFSLRPLAFSAVRKTKEKDHEEKNFL